MTLRQTVDPVAEGVNAAIAGAVDEVHWPFGFQRRFEHRQGRGDADAAADQHQGFFAGGQGELARWREQLDARPDVQLIVQMVGGTTAGFPLDADAVLAFVRQGRQ